MTLATLIQHPTPENGLADVQIIHEGVAYPRADMQPVVGLAPDLEWLLHHEPFIAPEFDGRFYVRQTVRSITTDPHPDYAHLNQYRITYNLVKRSADEIIAAVDDIEAEHAEMIVEQRKRTKALLILWAINNRRIKGQSITAKMTEFEDKALVWAQKLWQNEVRRDAIVADVKANNEPDLDDGWVL